MKVQVRLQVTGTVRVRDRRIGEAVFTVVWLMAALAGVHSQAPALASQAVTAVAEPAIHRCSGCLGDTDVQAAVTELFGAWTATSYGTQQIVRSDGRLRVDSRGPHQAALIVARDLDPAQKYRLALDGDYSRQQTRLRITRTKNGSGEAEFGRAPAARVEVVLTGIERIELVFYNDGDFAYTLKTLHLEPCPACFSDRELRQQIVEEVPAVPGLLAARRTLDAALALTDWVARVVDWGWDNRVVGENTDAIYWQPVADGHQVWTGNRGGAMCGAFTLYQIKVLDLFGIDAFSVNFGYGEGSGLTHVSTLVPVRDGRSYRFYVADPTFNGTFVARASGQPLDLEESLRRHRAGGADVTFKERAYVREHYVPADAPAPIPRTLATAARGVQCVPAGELGRRCSFRFDMRFFAELHRDDLARVGLSRNGNLLMHLLTRAVSDVGLQTPVEARRAFDELMNRHGIQSPALPQ